jgi:DNA-binding transcriptional ArsR family regulator
MRTSAPTLLPLFRSQLQGRLLAILHAEPDREHAISELVDRLDAHVATVHREVDRLERAGILTSRHVGRTKVVRANLDSPFEPELSSLVLKAFGPVPIISGLLARVPGIEEAHVYGSWAERHQGIPGAPPRDVDVLVVGRPDLDEVYSAAATAERLTGIPVDVVIRSAEAWKRQDDGLARSIRSGPRVRLDLELP